MMEEKQQRCSIDVRCSLTRFLPNKTVPLVFITRLIADYSNKCTVHVQGDRDLDVCLKYLNYLKEFPWASISNLRIDNLDDCASELGELAQPTPGIADALFGPFCILDTTTKLNGRNVLGLHTVAGQFSSSDVNRIFFTTGPEGEDVPSMVAKMRTELLVGILEPNATASQTNSAAETKQSAATSYLKAVGVSCPLGLPHPVVTPDPHKGPTNSSAPSESLSSYNAAATSSNGETPLLRPLVDIQQLSDRDIMCLDACGRLHAELEAQSRATHSAQASDPNTKPAIISQCLSLKSDHSNVLNSTLDEVPLPPIILSCEPFSSYHYYRLALERLHNAKADLTRVILNQIVLSYSDLPSFQALLDEYPCMICIDSWGAGTVFSPPQGSMFPNDEEIARAVHMLIQKGYGSRLVLSVNIFCKLQLIAYGGYGYAHLTRRVFPRIFQVPSMELEPTAERNAQAQPQPACGSDTSCSEHHDQATVLKYFPVSVSSVSVERPATSVPVPASVSAEHPAKRTAVDTVSTTTTTSHELPQKQEQLQEQQQEQHYLLGYMRLWSLLNWRPVPAEIVVEKEKLKCHVCSKMFVPGDHFSKFSFEYCSVACLSVHRRRNWK